MKKCTEGGYTVAVNMFARSRRSQAVAALQVRETGRDDFPAKAEIVLYRKDVGLNEEEAAFYDALTKPQAVMDFYTHDELIALTKELADSLRANRTIDWQRKSSARARMRLMVKKLLKKYKYPPEGQEEALNTVIEQCEMWADNTCD